MYDFMAKRQKQYESDGSDRISFLPKPILHHILSFIETPQVVQTCILSKTWKNIWRSVPTLDFFKINECTAELLDLVKFTDSLLFLRDGVNLRKLCLPLRGNDVGKVNGWIIYAMRHNVEVFEIRNVVRQSIPFTHILNSESLRVFRLVSTVLDLPASISLPALKVLKFLNVTVKDGQLEVLISAIPSLETLILEGCTFQSSSLTISATQLKNLVMSGEFPDSTVICTPNLVSLKLGIHKKPSPTITFDCSLLSLSYAILDYVQIRSQSLIQLMSTLKNARSLTLSEYFFAVNSLFSFGELTYDCIGFC
ncbi:hypothetical protein AQUCO_00400517v1 [Aquilegia coerulea]|uniref:F-box domain-containing protein n=1 Tax=Aquilegia coerulea TaxID=218851 RepID=A0A2G5EVB8_AQUCA|nr:hypothetical protein AQUCO_00400517v1 [Aquilegia coerulea]